MNILGKTTNALTLVSLLFAGATLANSGNKVAFQVELNGIKTGHTPLYISVQDAGKFRTKQGNAGTIIRTQEQSSMTVDLAVEPGIYAVSIWHDLDEDGKFSMDENYMPTDGWGSSGTPPSDRAPSFDEMKVEIFQDGQIVAIDMEYITG